MPSAMEANERLRNFKNKGKDNTHLRRQRNEVTIELRKHKREEQLLKRRNVVLDNDDEHQFMTNTSRNSQLDHDKTLPPFEEIRNGIFSGDFTQYYRYTQAARKILSREQNPPIDMFIEANMVPRFVQFLSFGDNPELHFEACWALTNIASGNSKQTQAVVEANGIPELIRLLSNSDMKVREQSVWAIGNIAGDGPILRDLTIEQGALTPLLTLANAEGNSIYFLRNVTWAISNLCRNKKPYPKQEVIQQILPTLCKFSRNPDVEVLADVCWAFSYLTDGDNERIDPVVKSGIVPTLVSILNAAITEDCYPIITPVLRALGNIVTGTDEHTDSVIRASALHLFLLLLQVPKTNIVKETAWAISNITAGNERQIEAVIDAKILPELVKLLASGDYKVQREVSIALTNLTTGGTTEQIYALCEANVIPPMCNLLTVADVKIVLSILEGLNNILQTARKLGEQEFEMASYHIEQFGGLDKLEELQSHENHEIYERATDLIANFFEGEEDPNENNLDLDHFQFNKNSENSVNRKIDF